MTPIMWVCVQLQPNKQPKYKVRKIKNTDILVTKWIETLCTKEKNHSVTVKLRKSTIQKK